MADLAELEARIEALEERPSADALGPTLVTIDENGVCRPIEDEDEPDQLLAVGGVAEPLSEGVEGSWVDAATLDAHWFTEEGNLLRLAVWAEHSAGTEGPPGPEGPEGKEGPAGTEGKEGPRGPEGPVGKEGPTGKEGPVGKEGPAGTEGKEGPAGPSELAEGVELPWKLEGIVKEKLKGFLSGTTSVIELLANVDKGREKGLAEIVALNAAGTLAAFAASAEKSTQRVFAEVGGISKTLLDSAGASDFVQLPTRQKTQLHFGIVSAAGTKLSGTEGWTVEKIVGPQYRVKFTTAFTLGPCFIAMDAQNTQRNASGAALSAKEINVVMEATPGTLEEIAFAFIAIG